MLTMLRVARLLRAESLDAVAAVIGARKAWVSTIERFPERHVSARLKRKLEGHFGAPWSTLSHKTSGSTLADTLLGLVTKQKEQQNARTQ